MRPATRTMPGKATPEDLFARFDELDLEYSTSEHPAVFTVAESRDLRGRLPGAHCKTLFLKDKKSLLWLVVVEEARQLDLKALSRIMGSARLSFASPDRLRESLGVEPGAVTPFALINDQTAAVNVVLDAEVVAADYANFHPLVNDKTTTMRIPDLLRFIEACGHSTHVVDMTPATRQPMPDAAVAGSGDRG